MTLDEARQIAGFMDKKKPIGSMKNLRDVMKFGIEWQRATGNLLMTEERTMDAGLAKLADADRREEEFHAWIGKDKE